MRKIDIGFKILFIIFCDIRIRKFSFYIFFYS